MMVSASSKKKVVGCGVDRAELELVLGDEDAHLLLDERGVVGLLSEGFGVDAAADEQAAGGCRRL